MRTDIWCYSQRMCLNCYEASEFIQDHLCENRLFILCILQSIPQWYMRQIAWNSIYLKLLLNWPNTTNANGKIHLHCKWLSTNAVLFSICSISFSVYALRSVSGTHLTRLKICTRFCLCLKNSSLWASSRSMWSCFSPSLIFPRLFFRSLFISPLPPPSLFVIPHKNDSTLWLTHTAINR